MCTCLLITEYLYSNTSQIITNKKRLGPNCYSRRIFFGGKSMGKKTFTAWLTWVKLFMRGADIIITTLNDLKAMGISRPKLIMFHWCKSLIDILDNGAGEDWAYCAWKATGTSLLNTLRSSPRDGNTVEIQTPRQSQSNLFWIIMNILFSTSILYCYSEDV